MVGVGIVGRVGGWVGKWVDGWDEEGVKRKTGIYPSFHDHPHIFIIHLIVPETILVTRCSRSTTTTTTITIAIATTTIYHHYRLLVKVSPRDLSSSCPRALNSTRKPVIHRVGLDKRHRVVRVRL